MYPEHTFYIICSKPCTIVEPVTTDSERNRTYWIYLISNNKLLLYHFKWCAWDSVAWQTCKPFDIQGTHFCLHYFSNAHYYRSIFSQVLVSTGWVNLGVNMHLDIIALPGMEPETFDFVVRRRTHQSTKPKIHINYEYK